MIPQKIKSFSIDDILGIRRHNSHDKTTARIASVKTSAIVAQSDEALPASLPRGQVNTSEATHQTIFEEPPKTNETQAETQASQPFWSAQQQLQQHFYTPQSLEENDDQQVESTKVTAAELTTWPHTQSQVDGTIQGIMTSVPQPNLIDVPHYCTPQQQLLTLNPTLYMAQVQTYINRHVLGLNGELCVYFQ